MILEFFFFDEILELLFFFFEKQILELLISNVMRNVLKQKYKTLIIIWVVGKHN